MKNLRIGKFYISSEFVNSNYFAEVLAQMQFIPYRVEFLKYRDAFEYIGTSPMFKEIVPDNPLSYNIQITKHNNNIKVTASVCNG